ncbi:MAG: hypothetical protein ABSB34_13680 [Candidatus Limnocylindrales bacterium]|jgi:uncharacterized membrane protein YphA (DoxX/SURF4 family)
MRLRFPARDIPVRLVTGAYVAHSGLEKWRGSAELAEGLHSMAANAFPFLRPIPPPQFLRMLAAGELVTGTLLLAPMIPNGVAGTALTVFSGGLVAMYARTPTMHKPGSIWPSRAGIAVSKDVWMLGIGLGLLAAGCHRQGVPTRSPGPSRRA